MHRNARADQRFKQGKAGVIAGLSAFALRRGRHAAGIQGVR
jgi:hypothetical protein